MHYMKFAFIYIIFIYITQNTRTQHEILTIYFTKI